MSAAIAPLVTVVIPTSGRPEYLPRSVESGLSGMGHDAEVIVVPNGADATWKHSLARFEGNSRVRIEPIREANANVARNAGLIKARGKYVRFLDDDDVLYAPGAIDQYRLLEESGADVASGPIDLIDYRDRALGVLRQPSEPDFCIATLGPGRRCLPVAHVYRTDSIRCVKWRPATRVRQDIEWQLDLCAAREFQWVKTERQVGAWRQHWSPRISQATAFNLIRALNVDMLLRTHQALANAKRLCTRRSRATADGLWELVHNCFFLDPPYWSRVAKLALSIDAESRPPTAIASCPWFRSLPPTAVEWILFPKRWPHHQFRMLLRKFHVRHIW